MKSIRFWALGLLAASLLSLASVDARAGDLLKGRPTAVAVVEVEKVFAALGEKTNIEGELTVKRENLQKDGLARQADIKKLKEDLDMLNASSPDFRKKQEQLEQKLYELESWMQYQQAILAREARLQMAQLYNKILAAIARAAKDGGYDLVLYKEGPPEFPSSLKNTEEVGVIIRGRKLLYAADDLDLTDQITVAMNNDYHNMVRSASQPAATPPKAPGSK